MSSSLSELIQRVPVYRRLSDGDRLAERTGGRVETSIRIMSRWGKNGIVQTEKEGFLVVDVEALERLSLH